jgi:hypothetical protein
MRAFCLCRRQHGWFYNPAMLFPLAPRFLRQFLAPALLMLGLGFASASWSQAPAPALPALPPLASQGSKAAPIEQRAERIVVEDAGSRIEELRIGGETKSIKVQPKGGLPPYEVQPENGSSGNNTAGTVGNRVWKILGF